MLPLRSGASGRPAGDRPQSSMTTSSCSPANGGERMRGVPARRQWLRDSRSRWPARKRAAAAAARCQWAAQPRRIHRRGPQLRSPWRRKSPPPSLPRPGLAPRLRPPRQLLTLASGELLPPSQRPRYPAAAAAAAAPADALVPSQNLRVRTLKLVCTKARKGRKGDPLHTARI